MRRYFYILLITGFFFLATPQIDAQQIQGAVITGMNLSQVDGDEIFGFTKIGFNGGLSAIVPIGKNFFFSLETLYNQKGSQQGEQYYNVDSAGKVTTGEYRINLNYLEVPFLFFYNDKDIIAAGAGLSYGRLVGVKEYEHGQLVETTTLTSGVYDRNDFNVLADIRFRIYKKFRMNLRYAYSLASIRSREFRDLQGNTWSREQYNNLISIRLIYMINEKPPIADDKNRNSGF